MKLEIPNDNPIKQLYCDIMAAVSLFQYLREQKGRKINISITLEDEQHEEDTSNECKPIT